MLYNKRKYGASTHSQNREKVKRGFDILCPFYNIITGIFFGKSLINSQKHFISKLKKVKSVLILGGGTGEILSELIKFDVGKSYYYLDISENMIRQSKKLITEKFPDKVNQVTFECGSYENINAYHLFDLVVTPYVLDCFSENETRKVIYFLNTKLTNKGQWLFVDFSVSKKSTFSEISSSLLIKFLYFFFNILCQLKVNKLSNFSKYFAEFKLEVVYEKKFLHDMLVGRIYTKSEN